MGWWMDRAPCEPGFFGQCGRAIAEIPSRDQICAAGRRNRRASTPTRCAS